MSHACRAGSEAFGARDLDPLGGIALYPPRTWIYDPLFIHNETRLGQSPGPFPSQRKDPHGIDTLQAGWRSRAARRRHARSSPGHPGADDPLRAPEQHRPSDQLGRQEVRRDRGSQERRQDHGEGIPQQPARQRTAAAIGAARRRAGDARGVHHVADRRRQGIRALRLPVPLQQRQAGRCDGRRPAGQDARAPSWRTRA